MTLAALRHVHHRRSVLLVLSITLGIAGCGLGGDDALCDDAEKCDGGNADIRTRNPPPY